MTRIHSLPLDQWDPDLRAMTQIDTAPMPEVQRTILGVYAQAPELSKLFFPFQAAMWNTFTLRRRLLEMVRLRIAFHNQCRSCMAMRYEPALKDGLTEDLVCSLEKPPESPDLTDAEKAALRFADLFATNHLAITDEVIEELRRHYTEKEIVELNMLAAFCTGYGRFAAVNRAVEDLPQSLPDVTTPTAPWANEHKEKVVFAG
jgi:AhpD family alkylhydroperoxidase